MESKKNRIKVLFLRSGYGMPDSRLEKELAALAEEYDVSVCAWDRDSSKDIEHNLMVSNYKIPFYHIGVKSVLASGFKKNLIPMFKFGIKMYKYLNRFGDKYDIVHASDFDTAFPAYMLKNKKKYKLIYDIYDYYADSHHMPRFVNMLIRYIDTNIINKSDATIICNEKREKQLGNAKPKKLCVIHNSPENKYIIPDYDNYHKNTRLRVVFIGAFSATGRYIKEMVDVIIHRQDVELIIGGYGYKPVEEYLRMLSDNYDNITYIGKQDYRRVLEIQATADVMTALYDPSLVNHQYAAPNKFYEALMLGKPIICAQNTYIDKIVRHNDIGWVLDVTSKSFESEFNKALDEAIAKRISFKIIEKRMRNLYLKYYNWDVMKLRLRKLYESL